MLNNFSLIAVGASRGRQVARDMKNLFREGEKFNKENS
jgi:hypothetical protein